MTPARIEVPATMSDPGDRDGTWEPWLRGLPALVDALLRDWDLTLDGPAAHGQCALVLPVRTEAGVPAALKVTWPHAEARHEHLALQHWHGNGAVALLRADPRRSALLLEPGVVVGGDAGEQRHLLAAQARHPAYPAVGRQPRAQRVHPGPGPAQEVRQLLVALAHPAIVPARTPAGAGETRTASPRHARPGPPRPGPRRARDGPPAGLGTAKTRGGGESHRSTTTEETPMSYPTDTPAAWFVTGASRGLGLELVRQLLDRGEHVAATTRSVERLCAGLEGTDTTRLLPLAVDLVDEQAVAGAVRAARERFGRLDVVVNNAGYGYLAAVEEVSDAAAREMFDVQVFGAWNVLRASLPLLRAQGGGHVINVSSILGLTAFPGWGLYSAGKYALEGLTESLAAEVAGQGITVNLVEPGYMRTDFLRPVSLGLPESTAAAYGEIRAMTEAHLAMPGTQLGDPARAAAAIIEVAVTGTAPLHQILGSDSYELARGRVEALSADLEAAHALALTTDIREG